MEEQSNAVHGANDKSTLLHSPELVGANLSDWSLLDEFADVHIVTTVKSAAELAGLSCSPSHTRVLDSFLQHPVSVGELAQPSDADVA